MDDFDDIPVIEDDSDDLETLDFSDEDLAEFSDDQDNPLDTGAEFSGQETTEVDGEEIILEIPDAEVNLDIFSSMSDDPDLQDVDELDETSTAVAETIEEYDNTAVIPTIGAVTAGERVMVVLKNGVPTAMGSTGFGDDINLRVHEIEADYIKAEVIEAERARVNNLLADKADISSLTAEQARVDNLLAGKASVSDLSAATGRIDDLEADHVSTTDLQATNAKVTNLETNALTANSAVIRDIQAETAKVENLTAESLSAATGYIAALKSASIEASDISADHATISAINSDYIKTSDLEAERAQIDNLLADKADISDLTAATGRIGALEADHVSTDDLEAEQARVNNLLAAKASVSDLTAEQARVDNLLADKADISTLEAEYAHVTNGTIDNAKINHADVTGLNAEVATIADARISQATITQAQVQNLSADYARITNGKINSALIDVAAIVDEQVFTVTGNKATIEEINADTITVRNLHTSNLVVDSAEGYVTIGNKRTPTKEALDELLGTLQNEIDGAVETFTSSAVPLLNNYPASDWQVSGATAEEQRKAYAKHVGDICYVQNAASAQNGYAYRFAYDSTEQTFKWVLIKDSDVTKALGDISDLQTFESETNTWIEETDEGLRTIRSNHTTLSGIVDKTLVSSTQLWFSKANTTAPNKPTAEVTSTSTAGNAWTTAVPAYNASYPNYFYCYQWKYADDTFGWSAVTRDIAMGESQAQARKGVSDAAAASNKATTAQNTANANIKSSVQLWFTKANNSAPTKPSSVISTNDAATGNAWNLAVPTYNASYPHYFYCYQQQKGDGTYQWTDVVYDRATTENQAVARAALPNSTFETFKTTTFKEIVDTVDEQSTSITTLTEKTSSLANPNLTPWFSAQNSAYWNTGFSVDYDYATGHGHSSSTEGSKDVTYLNDGWAHIIIDSRASAGNENKNSYINTWVNRNQLGDITPGGTYTWLIEVRNLSITKDTLRVRPSIGNATLDIFSEVPVNTTDSGCAFSEDGAKWIQVTAKSDLSNVTRDTRGYIYVITDVYVEADVRVSLYEGEYYGPYKPYVERLENITEISNTVNTVKQTADTNTASITNLTKTVSDNKTSIEQRASTIEQNLSGITTRVGKTETSLETVSNPNLSPFFSNQLSDIYNAETNPDGYWGNNLTGGNTKLSDGWTHYELSNTASSTRWLTIYEHCAWRHANGDLKGDTDYTVLMEFRNVTKTGNVTASGITTHPTSWPSMFRNAIDAQAITEGAELYFTGKTVSDPSAITGNSVSTRTLLNIPAGASISCDFRVSLYEGEYSGPYKPYVDQSLISRVSTAETSIKQHDDEIELRATKTELAKETRQRKGTYAECTTDAVTVNKAATISPAVSDFELYPGVTVAVCFTKGNNVASPKLNVNNTGLYPIVVNGTATPALEAVKWSIYTTAMFTFDIRNQWRLVSTDEDVRRLTNAETKIEQNAEAITLRATKEEFNNLTIGGRNLVWDTEWRDISNRWNVWGSPTTREIVAINGKRWLHLVTTTAVFQGYQQNSARREKVDPVNEIAPGDMLTVSFTAYAASAARWGVIGFHLTNASSIVKQEWLSFDITTTPQRFSASFTVPDNTDIDRFNIMIGDNSTQAHEVWISEVKLEKGNRATDWTPAPEDMATNVALSAEVKVASDSITSTVRKTFARNNIDQFFFNTPFRTSTDYDGGYWQPTSDNWLMRWATPLEEGWAHLSVSAGKQIELAIPRIESLKAGDQATLLFEWRNVTVEGNPNIYARSYPQNCQFSLNSYQCSWSTSTPTSGSKAVPMVCNSTATGTAAWNAAINLAMTNSAASGKSFEGDLRLSISTDVSRSDIISSINQSAETIKISADKVQINGTAVFSAIEDQLNDAYDTKGAAATVQENLDNLQVGGRNLLLWTTTLKKGSDLTVNGKDGIAGWTTNSLLVETADGIRLNAANISSECFGIPLANNGSVANNEQVLLTFEARGNVNSVGQFYWIQASGGNIPISNWLNGSNSISLSETEWRKFTADVTHAQANVRTCTRILFFYNLGSANNGKWIELRKGSVKLEKGNRATDWTPAPEDIDASIATVEQGLGGFDILWNRAEFAADTNAGGECYLCAYDPTTATRSDANGWAMWNGTKRTITKGAFNPNKVLPYNIPIYIVCRLNSATATTGTNYMVWYDTANSKWRSGPASPSTSTLADWTWAETTDIILGKFVEPGSEVAFTECETYRQPLKWGSITTDTVTARSANAIASAAQTTANNAAPKADAIARSQRIYYRATSASGKPAENKTWLAASGTGYGNWSLNIPQLKNGNTKYPFLYTAVQTQTVAQQAAGNTCTCTPVLIDETTTVIDGATIITGSIHSNSLDSDSVKANIVQTTNLDASKITSGSIGADRIKATVISAVNNGTGTINADKINVSAIKIGDLSGSIGGRNLLLQTGSIFPRSGTSSGYFIEFTVNNGLLKNAYELEEGVEYTFSADVTSSRGDFQLSVGCGTGGFSKDIVAKYGNSSGRVSVTFTPTAAQLASGKIFAFRAPRYSSQGTSFTYSVDNVKLEKGGKATDWTPAPEDQTTYVDDSVNGIQVGGRNILLGTGDWSNVNKSSTGTYTIDGTKSGCPVLKIVTASTATVDTQFANRFTSDIEPDTYYTLSFWAKASSQVSCWAFWYNPNAIDSTVNQDGVTSTRADGGIQNTIGTSWKRYSITWHTQVSATSFPQYVIPIRIQNAVTVWIAGCMFEKGNKPTDWTPAPEDISQMVKINTAIRNFTTAQWKSFGAVGHVENWTTGASYNNSHIHVGDTAYLTGTVTDGVKGTATIIGTVTGINGTTTVTMSSTQLIFGGDSVDSASKTATSYLTEGTSNGLMVHRSNDTTTGVKITDNVDIMRDGTSVAMFGTDGSGNALSRVGLADSGHTEQKSGSFDIYIKNETTQELLKAVSIHPRTSSGTLNTLEFYSEQGNDIHIDAEDFPDDDVLGPHLYIDAYCATANRITGVTLQASAMTGSQYKSASIEIEVQQDGTRKIRFGADDVWFNNNVIEGSAIASLPTSKLTGTIADTNLPIKDSAGTAGTSYATSGATLEVPYVTTDAYGRVTAKGTHTHTIGSLAASAVTSGTFDAARIPSLNASKITAGTFNAARIPSLNASKINAGTFDSARLPTVPIDKGGTGDTGVETVTAQATIFTSVTSGMTISNLTCATWGKMCILSFVVHPSAAQTSAFVIGTLAEAYRPVATCTANPYHSSVATARILTNGTIQMTAAPANEIPVSFTYLLA